MNINQLLFDTAYKELLVMLQRNGLSEYDLKKYFVIDNRKPESLQDVYIEFIRTASTNFSHTASIINFNENQTKISEILQGFNYEYVSLLSGTEKDKMSEKFIDLFNVQRGSDKEKDYLLTRWIKVVLFSAVFISGCRNIEGFYNRVNRTDDLKQVPIRISNEIEGFGFNSACDALTNLGYPEYVRPNWHLAEICTQLRIIKGNESVADNNISSFKQNNKFQFKVSKLEDYEAFDAIRRIAADNNVSPFMLDKVFQLVCSGNFFKDNKHIQVDYEEQRESIIRGVNRQVEELDAPLTEYDDNEKQKQEIAAKSLIDSFDKLDISESAPQDLNNKFETSINKEDIACIKEMCKSNRNDLLVKLLRPFASENSDTDLVEAEGYIYRVETLDDESIKVTFTITNDYMHKFNLMYLYSNFKKSDDGDYYIPLTFQEKAEFGDHLIDDLYYPFEYYYECIVSKEEAIKRKWLDETKELKYYRLEIKDRGSFFDKLNNKADRTGRIIFYDEENVHGGENKVTTPINKPESCNGTEIKSEHSTDEYFDALFESYEKSDICIYRVGQGNFITLDISYTDPDKKHKFLVFDAGTYKDKNFIDTNVASLQKSIEQSDPDEVYFMLSHYHVDHRTIMTATFEKMKASGENKDPKAFCILPSNGSHKDFDTVKLYSMGIFKERAKLVVGVPGQEIYKKSGIRVFQGESYSKGGWEDENSQSLMIQLKNTLLPADSYYRFWPDEYGIDYTSNPQQHKKFKYIVAPHHGFYYIKPIEYTNTIKIDPSDKKTVMTVFDVNAPTSKMYITCGGDDKSYNMRIINKLLVSLGIPKNLVEITYTSDNNLTNPIKFTDS